MLKINNEDCIDTMAKMHNNYIDLTVTSPPYDNLRKYNGYCFDFENVAKELFRVTKDGGVVVWIVADATIKGSETGTSFKQALYFMECGFNLHDTMIWEKTGRIPTQDRYYNVIEYMFVFSKGKPKSMNFIADHKCVNGGKKQRKDSVINKGENKKNNGFFIRNEFGRRSNIWKIHVGINKTEHPAVFPEQLAKEHIITWSNEGDLIYDPFLGSGTTALACISVNRNFIGSEISNQYIGIINKRINEAQLKLF
jgi:DNA modification methylase